MSAGKSVQASRRGRNLTNYGTSQLGFKSAGRRMSLFGKDDMWERIKNESWMKNANYDGRKPQEVKKAATLNRAIEHRRRLAEMSAQGRRAPSALSPPPDEHRGRGAMLGVRARPGCLDHSASEAELEHQAPFRHSPRQTPPQHRVSFSEGCTKWVDTRSRVEESHKQLDRSSPRSRRTDGPSSVLIEFTRRIAESDRGAGVPERSSAPGLLEAGISDSSMGIAGSPKGAMVKGAPFADVARRAWEAQQAVVMRRAATDTGAQSPRLGALTPSQAPVPGPANSAPSSPGTGLTPGPTQGMRARSPRQFAPSSPALGRARSPQHGGSPSRAHSPRKHGPPDLDSSRLSASTRASTWSAERVGAKKWDHLLEKVKRDAHYEYVVEELGTRPRRAVAEKEELDTYLASSIHEKGGSKVLPQSSSFSVPSMATAFTDRSLRITEGLGARTALAHNDATVEVGCSGCATCEPEQLRPAGQFSHSLHSNILHPAHEGTDAMLPTLHRSEAGTSFGKRLPGSPTFDSGGIVRQLFDTSSQSTELDELQFRWEMGCKVKQDHLRSLSEEPGPSAGRHPIKHELNLECSPHPRWRGAGPMGSGQRLEAAMICLPRPTDPPFPVRITPFNKRADGECKGTFSRRAEDTYLRFNQENYRYELDATGRSMSRSASAPPEPPRLHGATWTDLTEPGSGGIRCFSQVYDSSEMESATNQDLQHRRAASEREARLASDHKFADLCAITGDVACMGTQDVSSIRERTDAGVSSGMAGTLLWPN